jgi:hypothetical protein
MNQRQYLHFPQTNTSQYSPEAAAKHQAEEKLMEAIGDAHDILVRAKTVFPITLFPDTLTIDRTKVTVTHKDFFKVAEVLSIRIEDILNVTAGVGPIFGSIKISTRFFDPGKPYTIDHFYRADALKIKRVLQGYIIAIQKNVDCSALSTKELSILLDELGKVAPEEKV